MSTDMPPAEDLPRLRTLEEVAAHTWGNTLAVFGLKEEEVLDKYVAG